MWNSLTWPAHGAGTYGEIGGFNLGGASSSCTSQKTNIDGYIPDPGLQFFNFTDQPWTNNSALGYSGDGTATYGGLVYVPTWGKAGIVVAIGGQYVPQLNQWNDGQAYVPTNNISVFDPSIQTWYHQTASGDVPSERDRFCMVGTGAGDNSTFGQYIKLHPIGEDHPLTAL